MTADIAVVAEGESLSITTVAIRVKERPALPESTVQISWEKRLDVLEAYAGTQGMRLQHLPGLCEYYRGLLVGDRYTQARVPREVAILEKSYLK